MNVLILTQDFPPLDGGIAIFIRHICDELERNNVCLSVLAQDVEGAATFDNTQSHSVSRYPGRSRLSSVAPIVFTLFQVIKKRTDVLLLGHMLSTYGLGAWLLWKILRVPYVILIHGFDLVEYWRQSRVDRFVANIILRDAALIFANSAYTKEIALNKIAHIKEKIIVINPGVNTDIFKPGIDTSAIKQKYGIGDARILLTVGRLVPKKNHEYVLRALPEVLRKTPGLKYMIIGKGPQKDRLERITQQLGLQEHVIFTGHIEHIDLPSYYCLCDVFIMPSCVDDNNFESFGIVFAEANACGKPVIGSKTGGIPDAVIDGVTGLLVEPNDVKDIARSLINLLTDDKLARTLGINGQARVKNKLSWEDVGNRIHSSLKNLKELQECPV